MARILIGNIKGPKGDTGPQGLQGNVGPVGPQGPLPPLVNNGTTTETGFALDARYGKTLKDQLDTQNSNLNAKANTSDLANYVPKSNVVFESVAKVRFGTGAGVMNIDLYGGATTFYRLAVDNNSKKISFWVFDGTSLILLFEK